MVNVVTNGTLTLLTSLITSRLDMTENLNLADSTTPLSAVQWHCFGINSTCGSCQPLGGDMHCTSDYALFGQHFVSDPYSDCSCIPYKPYSIFKVKNDNATEIIVPNAHNYEIFNFEECDVLLTTQYEKFKCKVELDPNWLLTNKKTIEDYLYQKFQLSRMPVETSCYSVFRNNVHFYGSSNVLDYGFQLLFRVEMFDGEYEVYNNGIRDTSVTIPIYRRLVSFPYKWSIMVTNDWGLGVHLLTEGETECIYYNARAVGFMILFFIIFSVSFYLVGFCFEKTINYGRVKMQVRPV